MAPQASGKILLLLQRHTGFLVDGGERDDVHVGGGPLEVEAGERAGKGERSLVVQTHGMDGELEGEREREQRTTVEPPIRETLR